MSRSPRAMRPIAKALTVGVIAAAVLVTAAPAAVAHPLGNFTINHHVGVRVAPEWLDVDLVIDMAEIPAFQEKAIIDADGDRAISPDEATAYAPQKCDELAGGLTLAAGTTRLELVRRDASVQFPPGQAGLDTLRLECRYRANLDDAADDAPAGDGPAGDGPAGAVLIADDTYPNRLGWREIVVTSAGRAISTSLPQDSPSAVLTRYPEGPMIDVRRGVVTLGPVDLAVAAASDDAGAGLTARPPGPVGALGSLIGGNGLGVGPLLIGLAAAFGLGVAHALAPGHGKALMAAYLVGNRGRLRHAVGLGLSVAVSHTMGVAALGVATVAAAATFRPEAVYPYLATVSAIIVLAVGLVLVWRYVVWRYVVRRPAGTAHAHGHAHGHPHGHDHAHSHGHAHDHAHPHGGSGHGHDRSEAAGRTIGWKTLAALGLSGGVVPSASAVVLLLGAINLGRMELGVVLVFFFGLGMATALVGTGIAVVAATRLGFELMGDRPWVMRLATVAPAVMAIVVTVVGIAMTVNALGGFAA